MNTRIVWYTGSEFVYIYIGMGPVQAAGSMCDASILSVNL